jgi:hypothetical protein
LAAVRLLEHQGRPGLAIMSAAGVQRLVSAWQADGTEGDADFMLLIPEDELGRQRLQHLGTTDWATVTALAECLQDQVARQPAGQVARWRVTAARLSAQLGEWAARFRYDGLTLHSEPGYDHRHTVTFRQASAGHRRFGDVTLHWDSEPDADAARVPLRLQAPVAPELLVLGAWPVASKGTLDPTFAIPVGDALARSKKRLGWSLLPDADQRRLLSMLDALAAAAQLAPSAAERARLQTQARTLHADARRTLRSIRLQAALQRASRLVRRPGQRA